MKTYKCPTQQGPQGGDIVGCGHVFHAEPDDEGLVDCPECGIWFKASEPGVLVNS